MHLFQSNLMKIKPNKKFCSSFALATFLVLNSLMWLVANERTTHRTFPSLQKVPLDIVALEHTLIVSLKSLKAKFDEEREW